MLTVLLFAAAAHATCTTPWFPAGVKSLRYRQVTTQEGIGDTVLDMTWKDIRVDGDTVRMTTVTKTDDGEPATASKSFRCTAEGLTPAVEGVRFDGVQFGHDLTTGARWKFKWAATGIYAVYAYYVDGPETITVKAGKFNATRISYRGLSQSDTRGRGPEISGTLWFADGVGLIKQVEDDPALGLVPQKTTMELVETK